MLSGNVVAGLCATAIACSAVYEFGSRQFNRLYYDDKTPFVETLSVSPKKIQAAPGETVDITYRFNKRPGCHGRVTYRLVGHPQGVSPDTPPSDFPFLDVAAGWPSGARLERVSPVTIPPYVPPGSYELLWIALAPECEAAGEQKATSPGHHMESRSLPVSVTVTQN